ncbi:MAG TPA: threonine synthase [Gemmatimonadales bacterium]|nr:threonine synthase [Gemmatimonadales bacterium]
MTRTRSDWILSCPACDATASPDGLPTLCSCGHPWLVRYPRRRYSLKDRAAVRRGRSMWRFADWLPIMPGEEPVSLGEGDTPLLAVPRTAEHLGLNDLWIKDEGVNPTGSFKSRGIAAAVTRASIGGARGLVLPTAGNAGVASSAYGARAGLPVRVYAPRSTPPMLLSQVRRFGGDLVLVDGHIGDCGKLAREFAQEHGWFDLSTLKEPYRIEGKKTLGLELAMQFDWRLPDVIIYPTGGGTGLIGMWKAFQELDAAGWTTDPAPRMYTVQSEGCAPMVRAFSTGAERAEPWKDPATAASGLRVPGPIGDRLMLQALRESEGGAVAVSDEALLAAAASATSSEGIDFSPEGGAALAAAAELTRRGEILPNERVVVFNTGAGWLYQSP